MAEPRNVNTHRLSKLTKAIDGATRWHFLTTVSARIAAKSLLLPIGLLDDAHHVFTDLRACDEEAANNDYIAAYQGNTLDIRLDSSYLRYHSAALRPEPIAIYASYRYPEGELGTGD
jgi:hypothetical protein